MDEPFDPTESDPTSWNPRSTYELPEHDRAFVFGRPKRPLVDVAHLQSLRAKLSEYEVPAHQPESSEGFIEIDNVQTMIWIVESVLSGQVVPRFARWSSEYESLYDLVDQYDPVADGDTTIFREVVKPNEDGRTLLKLALELGATAVLGAWESHTFPRDHPAVVAAVRYVKDNDRHDLAPYLPISSAGAETYYDWFVRNATTREILQMATSRTLDSTFLTTVVSKGRADAIQSPEFPRTTMYVQFAPDVATVDAMIARDPEAPFRPIDSTRPPGPDNLPELKYFAEHMTNEVVRQHLMKLVGA
jgi:hypothetical protein